MNRGAAESIELAGTSCRLWIEGEIENRPLLVLGHGAGAPGDSSFMVELSRVVREQRLSVARFNFPYMQKQIDTGRRRPPDRSAKLVAAWATVITHFERLGPAAIFIGGKSMGGRMASHWASEHSSPYLRGLIYLGYPLHPANKPEALRRDHLGQIKAPQLFVSGTRDKLAERDRLAETIDSVGAEVYWVEGGDHSLAVSRKTPFSELEPCANVVVEFIRRHSQGSG